MTLVGGVRGWARSARNRLRRVVPRVAWRALGRHLPNEAQHMFALTLVVGVVCGFVAVGFHLAIRAAESLLIDRALHAQGATWMVWTVVSPTLGGLLAGAALTWLVPGARGSGIPQVKQAFAVEGGRITFRDAVGKFIVGSLQIGSGASLGREGPTVHICAGTASLLARATSLPPRNMRRLTPVGVAAGIAAAFNAPIAAVTFTIEEVVGTLDQTVLSGVVVAAALAAVIERGILGVHPVIEVHQAYGLDHSSSLALFAALGMAAAVVSVAFTDGLLALRRGFRALHLVPAWMHPGLGGLVTGVLAVLVVRYLGTSGVTGGGYETLGHALAGQLGVRVLVVLCVAKLVATLFSYSSGGAGGIFAPSLFVGAMLGGAVGHLDVLLLGHEQSQLGAFALVGMGAVFAGVIRAPITSVLIIFEMTGGYGLVLPLMLANMTCYVLARRWRPTPIYEALLAQDGIVLPHTTERAHVLERLRVSDAMTAEVITLRPWQAVGEGLRLVAGTSFTSLPVSDEAAHVLGVVAVAHLRDPELDPASPVTAVMRPGHVIPSDAPLLHAVVLMNDLGVRQLLVVDRTSETRLVGVLAMSDVVRAHARAAAHVDARVLASPRTGPRSEHCARGLMRDAAVVAKSTRIAEIAPRLRAGRPGVFIVGTRGEGFGVLLAEHLAGLVPDEGLERMLIAADVARPAPSVDASADLAALVASMRDDRIEAAVVLDGMREEPVGVVTKVALAMFVLDWYASAGARLEHEVPPGGESTPKDGQP